MYIKIYNKSQLILLEQINPLLGKYRLPLELLKEVEKILVCEKMDAAYEEMGDWNIAADSIREKLGLE